MPSVDLIDKGNGSYAVDYSNFTKAGVYNIAVFAIDKLGYISEPKTTTVTVGDYIVLTDASPNYIVPEGSYVRVFGSSGVNKINVPVGAKIQCVNFVGANQINIQESSFQCKVRRSGATVYISGSSGMSIKIPATKTAQTLRFGDGSSTIVITGGKVMLGSQEITRVEVDVAAPQNSADTSEGVF